MDVDDAIWLSWPFGQRSIPRIAKKMDAVVAGNSYLADYFSQYCKNVHIVPTAIDLDRYHPKSDENKAGGDKFIIGWTGLACNYKYLQLIEQPLKRFLDDHADAQLMLVANRTWNSETISPERITFVQWTKENEATALHDMTIGVMPLSDDNWTRGKCSFKMLQYMATALPIVISPVGMNADILQKGRVGLAASTADEWYSAIESLYKDHKLRTEIGKTGRSLIEQCYSADIVADQLAEIFKELAAR